MDPTSFSSYASLTVCLIGIVGGIGLAVAITLLCGVYTIGPAERGVLTTFGRSQRLPGMTGDDPQLGALLLPEEVKRYNYPNISVIQPGGPYFKWPWQHLYRVDMTIQTVDIAWDPEVSQEYIEAVTKDNLTVQLSGQLRWKPCERNLYAFLFGVKAPAAHVIGYFVSVLRDRIATFHVEHKADPAAATDAVVSGGPAADVFDGVSINDLRRNLNQINQFMDEASRKTSARYGIQLDAVLIAKVEPPKDVDEALASINTTMNLVAAEISQAKADASQRLQLAEQAVEIATNRAQAEAAPLDELNNTLTAMFTNGGGKESLDSYVRNASLPLREMATQSILKVG